MQAAREHPPDSNPHTKERPGRDPRWWAALVLAGVAWGLSVYLTFVSLTGGPAAGCGDAVGGCAGLLNSAWSHLWGIPVAGLAAGLYAVVIAALLVRRRVGGVLLPAAATAVAGAALWFVYVQHAQFGAWCLYCTTTHGVGVAMAAVVLIAGEKRGRGPGVALGLLGVAVLTGGQWLSGAAESAGLQRAEASRAGQTLTLLDGRLTLNLDEEIVLGDPQNPRLLVEFFDYHCSRCRANHAEVNRLREQEGFTLVLVPVPLSGECNPGMRNVVGPASADACALAKLALIVHDLDPQAFDGFHEWAFAGPRPTAAGATVHAGSLVDEVLIRLKASDLAYDQTILRNTTAWADARAAGLVGGLPVFIASDGGLVSGAFDDGEKLRALIDTLPAADPPAADAVTPPGH